jgi:hypothetical protein
MEILVSRGKKVNRKGYLFMRLTQACRILFSLSIAEKHDERKKK